MHLWRRLITGYLKPPHPLSLQLTWPDELEVRVAESEEELEKAFHLLHDTYVREGLMSHRPSEMRILPQQLLPQSSVVVALWNKQIVAAVSLIRDNPLGLPIEQNYSLQRQRKGGNCLAEMSILAMDPLDEEMRPLISFPLLRFVFQYARKCFSIQSLVLEAGPASLRFYRDVLLFHRTQLRSMGLVLDLETAPENWQKVYGDESAESNLAQYMAQEVDHPGCKLPARVYGLVSDLRMTPQLLEKLYLRKAGLLNTLKREEVRVIQDAYPHASFESILKNLNWSPDGAPKREIRLDALMSAQIVEDEQPIPNKLQVKNISRHGLQLWSEKAPKLNEVITIEVKLNNTQSTRLCAQVKWTDATGHSGLRILSYSSEWSVMLQSIEGQLAKLAASK